MIIVMGTKNIQLYNKIPHDIIVKKLMIFCDMNKGKLSYNGYHGYKNKRSQLYNRNKLYNIRD